MATSLPVSCTLSEFYGKLAALHRVLPVFYKAPPGFLQEPQGLPDFYMALALYHRELPGLPGLHVGLTW